MGLQRLTSRAPLPHSAWVAVTALTTLVWARGGEDEPRKASEPSVMREPAEIVQVADAFDGDDLLDLHLSLGYSHSWRRAKIYRETSRPQGATGDFTPSNMNVAKYSQDVGRLNTRAD